MPDVTIESLKTNSLIEALEANNIVFDFATKYFYDHDFGSVADFYFSSTDYNAFKAYVEGQNFSYQTKTEKVLEETINSDDALLGSEVQEKYKDLLLAVNRGKITALDTFQKVIQKIRNS